MVDYGKKITQAGYDIDSTEEREYIFWSKLSTVKIFSQGSGTVTIPASSSSALVDIAHGLSFIPMYLVFSQLKDGSGKWFLNGCKLPTGDADADEQYVEDSFSGGSGFPYVENGLRIDATNLRIEYGTYDDSVSHDIDYYYYIFGDKGGS